VGKRTGIRNAIHALLARGNISLPPSNIFSKRGMEHLLKLELPPLRRFILDGYLEVLKALTHEIKKAEERIKEEFRSSPEAQLLSTVPG
jgi:transposase